MFAALIALPEHDPFMIDGSLCVSGATVVSIDLDGVASETGRT